MSTIEKISRGLTAEEYSVLPADGRLTELVRGKVVEMNRPFTSHGYYANLLSFILTQFVKNHDLGRVVVGDAGVVTQRSPDTVRGPDVAYYSYKRIPRGPLPDGYWPQSPELVFEIRSADDRWKDILQKVGEYLGADVLFVVVLDPATQRVHVFSADQETRILSADSLLEFPEILPGFDIAVGRLFDSV